MKTIPSTTRRQILTVGGIGALAALLTARVTLANHHIGGGDRSAVNDKCKKLRDKLKEAKRRRQKAKARRLRKQLRRCLRMR